MVDLINSLEQKFSFKNNLIVEINGTYFGKYQPDSGLVIDEDKLIVTSAKINPTQIDLKRAVTQINSSTVTVMDGLAEFDFMFSAFMGADSNALVGKEMKIYFGRINEALDFSDYIEINRYIISNIQKSGPSYVIRAKSQEDKAQVPVFKIYASLLTSITPLTTTVEVQTSNDIFSDSGLLKIEDEIMEYDSKVYDALNSKTTFNIIQRGWDNTEAVSHASGEITYFIKKLVGNPIDLLLQLLISNGGGGIYDVLEDGAGISETLIDVAGFEAIRDEYFLSNEFTLYLSQIDKLLTFIEDELLEANNIRLIKNSLSNLISIALLGQATFGDEIGEIDDSITILNSEKWNITKDGLQTVVNVKWDWSEGEQRFLEETEFKASQEILNTFGEIGGTDLEFKGITKAQNGASIVQDRATRYLARFSSPKANIKLDAFMQTFKYNVGDKVRVTAKNLPQEGGSLGMSSILEIVNRAVNADAGVVSLGFAFTAYTNVRGGLISPSPVPINVVSANTFDVPNGDLFKAGYVLVLWDRETQSYLPDAPNPILEVNGNTITMENDWASTINENTVLFFADYQFCNAEQKAKYAFIVDASGFFADGSKGYQIIL